MQAFDLLTTISEVSIALAGFGGIAAGLGYRARGAWHSDDLFRLLLMVVLSLSIVFACFIPFVILAIGIDDPWRISAVFVLLTAISHFVIQTRRFRKGLPPGYNLLVTLTIFGTNAVALGLAVILVTGLADSDLESGIYLAAMLFLLLTPSILFVRLIVTAFAPIQNEGGQSNG